LFALPICWYQKDFASGRKTKAELCEECREAAETQGLSSDSDDAGTGPSG